MEFVKNKIKFIFTRNLSIEQLTLSIVLGLTCGLFPIPFLTSVACVAASFIVSVNLPVMISVNLLITPIELAMIPIFIMGGNYIGIYQLMYGFNSVQPSMSISDLITSLKTNAIQGMREFADILLVAVVAWSLFVPIASIILYYVFKPIVSTLMTKYKKTKTID